jgi:signal transduction histidine kinase
MKTKPRNEKARLLLTLELAVILPAAALVIVSAWHVLHIQRDHAVEAAIQREYSQVLAISEKQLNHKANELVDDVRTEIPAPGEACSVTLDRILSAHPYVAHVFVISSNGDMVFRSQPERAKSDSGFRGEAEYLSKMYATWLKIDFASMSEKLVHMEKKGTPYIFETEWVPRGDKKVYQSTALFAIKGEEKGETAIAGVAFDADYLRDKFFPEMLDDVISRNANDPQSGKSHAVMMLRGKYDSAALVQSGGWDGGTPEVERNLEGAFQGLTLAIKLRGSTIAAIGERFARMSLLTLAALSLVLAGGIALTYRNVTKEMALARLKSDFVSNVSHELRTPLSLIRLYAETLEMGRLTSPEKYQEYYRIIRKESERLTALINNILDFSRIEAGRKEYDFRETDMSELVHNTLDSYRYQLEQNGFQFEEKIDEVPSLRVDREAMARSLLNLVNNALKYSQDRKFIGVNLYRDNGSVKLEVVDQGIGIPHDEQQKIFEKFYRVGDPLVHNTKGSGLGLSLVRHIVQAHGGQVSVDSTPGQGSKFTIALPVKQAHNGSVATA